MNLWSFNLWLFGIVVGVNLALAFANFLEGRPIVCYLVAVALFTILAIYAMLA